MSLQLVIMDSNSNYAVSLMEYINFRQDIPMSAAAYFDDSEYEKRLANADFLLYDENINLDEEIISIPKLKLTNRRTSDTSYLFRYQRVDEIVHRVMSSVGTIPLVEKLDCQIYGIYSPIGRSGKSSLAKAICEYYPQSLYIGMEEFPGTSDIKCEGQKNERFFYYWLGKESGIVEYIKDELEIDASNHLYWVSGLLQPEDYRNIRMEHMEYLCKLLRESGYFTRVVFDIGCGVLDSYEVFSAVDRIIVPMVDGDIENAKLSIFKKRLEAYPDLCKKINVLGNVIDSDLKDLIEREGM